MEDLKSFIQRLKSEGEQLLNRIPKKQDFKEQERAIKKQHKQSLASAGRSLLSRQAGNLASSIFGGVGSWLGK